MGIFESIKNALAKGEDEQSQEVKQASVELDQPPEPPEAGPGTEADSSSYIVQSGDTLFSIAERVYGNGSSYLEIFEANRDVLDSPDHILPGQTLSIPARAD